MQLRAENKRIEKLVGRLAPAVPAMRMGWLEEPVKRDFQERNKRQVLEQAGLLKPDVGKGKKKARSWEDEHADEDRKAATIGKKTLWCEGVQDREYMSG
jgi:hypothetical protein